MVHDLEVHWESTKSALLKTFTKKGLYLNNLTLSLMQLGVLQVLGGLFAAFTPKAISELRKFTSAAAIWMHGEFSARHLSKMCS